MRNRKQFFSVAVAAAALLLAGTVAVAQQAPLTSCTTPNEGPTFTVTSGPSFVPCDPEGGGECTEIEYHVSGFSGSVYALEGKGVVDFGDEGTTIGLPCEGVNGFGEGACHEQAIRTFPDGSGKFKITLAGQRRPSPTSVAIQTEGGFDACEILGIGLENSPNPEQTTQTTETVDFKGCVVEFTRDAATGEVVRARLTTPDSRCTSPFLGEGGILIPQPVTELELRLKDGTLLGTSLGKGKFGDGYISTGEDSCTTRVVGGRVYTWGAPCS